MYPATQFHWPLYVPRCNSHAFFYLSFTTHELPLHGRPPVFPLFLNNSWLPCLYIQPNRTWHHTIMPTSASVSICRMSPIDNQIRTVSLLLIWYIGFVCANIIKKLDRTITFWKKNSIQSNNLLWGFIVVQYSGITKVKQVLGGYPRVEREQFRHANKNNGR